MSENAAAGLADALKRRIDPPVAIAFGCVIAACCSWARSIRAAFCRPNICCSN